LQEATIELVMSEFGAERRNAGGASFGADSRLNPTLGSFRQQFPDARVTLYADFDHSEEGIEAVVVDPPFDRSHPRYGWRAHDYYQAYGLLRSSADVAIAMDSDMLIVSDRFRTLVPLVQAFGLAVPANSRIQVRVDVRLGIDSAYDLDADPTEGTGFAYNLTPIAFATDSEPARRFLERYCRLMREQPGRAGLRLWQAALTSRFNPYLLPYQWCVCRPGDVDSRHIWADPIVLHVGHPEVYPRFLRTRRRQHRRALAGQWRQKAGRVLRTAVAR
jgi:hypothetical protein